MNTVDYLDFVLIIEKHDQQYRATVVHSPVGKASQVFSLPFGRDKLENFVLKLAATRRGTRGIRSPQWQAARDLGRGLFEAVFRGEVLHNFRSSQLDAERQGRGLRLKLSLEAPELINIPWEYLYDRSRGRFLCMFERTPVVRYVEMPVPVPPLSVKPPLSVLVMISWPEDQPVPLDVEREQANMEAALSGLVDARLLTVTRVPEATLPALDTCLLRGRYHVFHYIGHALYDEDSRDGLLVLDDGTGRSRLVSGETLAILLGNHRTLRLAVLNACEGARTSDDDPFAGMATSLVRTGDVPAVIAMQFPISDEAAVTFTRGFYTALSAGRPVDAAVTRARLAILADAEKTVEWGTPVLYLRAPDGRIFEVEPPAPEAQTAHLDALREQAVTLLEQKQYEGAQGLLAQIQAIDPGHRDVALLMEQARSGAESQERLKREEAQARARREGEESRKAQVARLLAAAEGAARMGDWPQAIQSLEELLRLEPGHEEAAARLAQAREALKEEVERKRKAALAKLYRIIVNHVLSNFYEEARRAHQAGQWQAVLDNLDEIRKLDAAYADRDGLRASAERGRELEFRYAQGLRHVDAGEWAQAVSHLQAVEKLDPNYRDVAALLYTAKVEVLHPSIAVNLSVKPDTVETGQEARWTVSLRYDGADDLHDVTVTGPQLPLRGPFDLAAGQRRRFTFTTTYNTTGKKTETVSVTGVGSIGQEVRAEARASVRVRTPQLQPSIALKLSVKPEAVETSQEAKLTVSLHNDGNDYLRGVTVNCARMPAQAPFGLAAGRGRRFTFITTYDTAGDKVETVSVTGVGSSGQQVRDEARAGLRVSAPPQKPEWRFVAVRPWGRIVDGKAVGTGTLQQALPADIPKKPGESVFQAILRWKRAHPSGPPPDPDQILRILKEFAAKKAGAKFHVDPDIPAGKLRNARKSCEVPEDERILGLLDCTAWGSAKDCLLFGSRAVFYHNGWFKACPAGRGSVPYSWFSTRTFERWSGKPESVVSLGGEDQVALGSYGMSVKTVVKMLNAIKELVAKSQK
jgi:tetratricopeptide (TPR) repeat protein